MAKYRILLNGQEKFFESEYITFIANNYVVRESLLNSEKNFKFVVDVTNLNKDDTAAKIESIQSFLTANLKSGANDLSISLFYISINDYLPLMTFTSIKTCSAGYHEIGEQKDPSYCISIAGQ